MPHRNMITRDDDRIVDAIRNAQRTIRRLMDERFITLKQVAADSGIPYNTLVTYFHNDRDKTLAALPVAALFRLIPVLPADMIDLLLPEGYAIVQVDTVPDHDGLAADALAYASEHAAARHPNSPGGVEIVPSEEQRLNARAVKLRRAA